MCWSCYLTSMPSFIAHLKFCNCELVHKYIVGLVIAIKKGINIQNFTHLQNADASYICYICSVYTGPNLMAIVIDTENKK